MNVMTSWWTDPTTGLILGEYHKGLRSNVHFLSCAFIVLQPNNHIIIVGINNIL